MADIAASKSNMNDTEISSDAPLTEALLSKISANINYANSKFAGCLRIVTGSSTGVGARSLSTPAGQEILLAGAWLTSDLGVSISGISIIRSAPTAVEVVGSSFNTYSLAITYPGSNTATFTTSLTYGTPTSVGQAYFIVYADAG